MTVITSKRTILSLVMIILGGLLMVMGYQDRVERAQSKSQLENSQPTVATGPQLPAPIDQVITKPHLKETTPGIENIQGVTGDEYFAEYRITRERIRSREIESYKQVVDNPNSDPEARQEAQYRLLDVTRRIEQELHLEQLIKAKGYKEVVVHIQNGGVTAIIKSTGLKPEDMARIADLIVRTTGFDLAEILIIPKD